MLTQYCQIIAEWESKHKYIVYKRTNMFKTWTDRQIASRRHVFLRASLTIASSTITPTPRALESVHRPKEKKNENSATVAI